jgi:hypothetical protein
MAANLFAFCFMRRTAVQHLAVPNAVVEILGDPGQRMSPDKLFSGNLLNWFLSSPSESSKVLWKKVLRL